MKENKAKIIAILGITLILLGTIAGVFWARGKSSKNQTTKNEEAVDTTTAKSSDVAKKKVTEKKKQESTTKEVRTTQKAGKDQYQTNPTPKGKPAPKEPQDTKVDPSKTYSCTIKIVCNTVLGHMDDLKEGKESIIPKDGVILKQTKVTFSKGENVYDVLLKVTKEQKIHFESSKVLGYNSRYIEGIGNLYEKDCGELSGWMYKVNDWFPNYGCSRYVLKDGDTILWQYTCDLGDDIGGNNG